MPRVVGGAHVDCPAVSDSPDPHSAPLPRRSAGHQAPLGRARAGSVAALAVLALLAAGCGDDTDAGDSSSPTTAATTSDWSSADAGKQDGAPTITEPDGPAPDELVVDDITVGDGTEVADGMIALVDYVGANYSNGAVFDASYGGAPFAVPVGAGMVIKGWDQGLVGMKVGGRRQLIIPPDLAYGDQAQGPIGANETLIFIVELRAALARPTPEAVPGGTVTELVSTDLADGSGDRRVEDGDSVTVHYVGVHGATGEPFDASWDRGQPFTLTVGAGEVIKGWDQGLVGMRLGGRRRLAIPGALAYGPEGRPPTIGADETLVFDIDVVGIE